jgi:hypothetical protein
MNASNIGNAKPKASLARKLVLRSLKGDPNTGMLELLYTWQRKIEEATLTHLALDTHFPV